MTFLYRFTCETDRNSQNKNVFQLVNSFIKNFCLENEYFPCKVSLNAIKDSNTRTLTLKGTLALPPNNILQMRSFIQNY